MWGQPFGAAAALLGGVPLDDVNSEAVPVSAHTQISGNSDKTPARRAAAAPKGLTPHCVGIKMARLRVGCGPVVPKQDGSRPFDK